ncbi:mannonate dehydratase [Pontibacillus salicampi]|uniref:Mannonate dehydratase n=1 Tax=Pontibacillus salicampi TaxID=1449801 RepID=A0ABV6LTZ1_9BACI
MDMSFRWYGEDDAVKLEDIRQIPFMKGIVTAIYNIPPGDVWPVEKVNELKKRIEAHGLTLNVIESVPVHEDIKLGLPSREHYIANYQATLRNLSKAGVKTVCYNFMPVFDWTRTAMEAPFPDGSHSLAFDQEAADVIDPLSGCLTLPGWDLSYQTDQLSELIVQFKRLTENDLMNNLIYFLEQVVPVAEEEDIKLALHPDDPPWSVFGLPRVVTNETNVAKLLRAVDSQANGLTFCTGSYGANPENNLISMIEMAKGRIHFVHARNVKWTGPKSFQETSHSIHDGSLLLIEVMEKLIETGYNGPIRPDHGRMIWGESGRPGYGLYDRALGASYLNGIIDTVKSRMKEGDQHAASISY